jgi:hypothetical protein
LYSDSSRPSNIFILTFLFYLFISCFCFVLFCIVFAAGRGREGTRGGGSDCRRRGR